MTEDQALLDFLQLPLPADRIATVPSEQREAARLLRLDRHSGAITDNWIADLPKLLRPGDLLVLNRSRVRKALTIFKKTSGAAVELIWLRPITPQRWRVFGETSKLRLGMKLTSAVGNLTIQALTIEGREAEVAVDDQLDVEAWLDHYGQMPLPPYIRKRRQLQAQPPLIDIERYQNTYARELGSIAAPTAGLHFSQALLDALQQAGIERSEVVLHVGPGTFTEVDTMRWHEVRVSPEWAEIPEATAAAVMATRKRGGRIVAIGTTSLRTLEGLWLNNITPKKTSGFVDFTARPGHVFSWVDVLLTNFHLPQTSLRLLVAAFAGSANALAAYQHSCQHGGYRYYSYGDAMLII